MNNPQSKHRWLALFCIFILVLSGHSSSSSTVVAARNSDASVPPKLLLGFLDDTGTGSCRLVETASSDSNIIQDNSHGLAQEENHHHFHHQVSLKDSNWNKRRRISHTKATVLTLLLAVLWSPPLHHVANLQPVRFLVLVLYLLECATCSTRKYLANTLAPSDLETYLKRLQDAAPKIIWNVECFHYRTVRRREHGGSGRTATHHEKVVTRRASSEFCIKRWKDVTSTASLKAIIKLDGKGRDALSSRKQLLAIFVKTSISKLFVFTNPTIASRYLSEEANFITREGRYDSHYFFERRLDLGGVDSFLHKLLVVRTGLSDVVFASQVWFWIVSLVGLTVPFRIWFSNHCHQTELSLTKTIDL